MLFSSVIVLAIAAGSSLAAPCQKASIKGIPVPTTPLRWGDWNFLHTTDTHGYQAGHEDENGGIYNANWADFTVFVRDMKRKADAQDQELFLIDSGDIHDGSALSDNVGDKVFGVYSTPMIQETDYDVLALGNHELYQDSVARDMYTRFGPAWGGKYLASNTEIQVNKTDGTQSWVPISQKYRYFKGTKGTNVLSFGWIFNFTGGIAKTARVNPIVEEVKKDWFKEALTNKPIDLVIMAGHVTLREKSGIAPDGPNPEWLAAIRAVRAFLPDTPIVIFGGHRHVRDYYSFGPNIYALSSGRYMETVGFLSLTKDGKVSRRYLDSNIPTFNYHLERPLDFALGKNAAVGKKINEMIEAAKIQTNYSQVYGCAPQDYFLSRVPSTDPSSIFSIIGKELAGVLKIAAGDKFGKNPVFAIVNGGGQRFDVFAGEFTVADSFNVLPFKNVFRTIRNVPFSTIKIFRATLDTIKPSRRRNLASNDAPANIVAREDKCTATLGLVTIDDIKSEAGDDTLHCPLPFFPYPNYVYSPQSFPAEVKDEQLYDLIFYDFIEPQVKVAYKQLTNTDAVIENYIDPNFNSLLIWPTLATNLPTWKC
ncbi:hypothetical protein HDU97_005913 [Phlyctochytrium planicorne]|nr:hypothetical protein HDU97_005913 [Phlyctochytrium planicorne]